MKGVSGMSLAAATAGDHYVQNTRVPNRASDLRTFDLSSVLSQIGSTITRSQYDALMSDGADSTTAMREWLSENL